MTDYIEDKWIEILATIYKTKRTFRLRIPAKTGEEALTLKKKYTARYMTIETINVVWDHESMFLEFKPKQGKIG